MWGMSPFMTYLVIINIAGFLLYLINTILYRFTAEGQIDAVLTIVSLLGGSLGIVLSILIFDRTAEKGNMMSRVFVSCILVIQIVLFLVLRGHYADHLTLAFWTFFDRHKILVAYLVIINFVTFASYCDNVNFNGYVMALFYVAIGAVELAVALYIFYLMYEKKQSENIDKYGDL